MKQRKCKNCKGTGFVPLGEGIKGIKVCPYCKGKGIEETNMKEIKTEKDIYSDQQMTLTEVISVVLGKIANGMPMMTAKEEFIEDVVRDWAELWGYETAK